MPSLPKLEDAAILQSINREAETPNDAGEEEGDEDLPSPAP